MINSEIPLPEHRRPGPLAGHVDIVLYETSSTKRKGMAPSATISGPELRARIDRLGFRSYSAAAAEFGLTLDGLQKQMRGARAVSRQTAVILGLIEELRRLRSTHRQSELPLDRQQRRNQRLAQYLYPTVPRRK